MKTVVSFCLLWLLPLYMWAQPKAAITAPPDSTKTYQLNEIVVSNESIDNTLNKEDNTNTTASVGAYLSKIGGVDVVQRGAYAAEPVYRGMAGERAPVTINNMKIFSACTDKMDPVSSYVSTNNIKSISISKDAQNTKMTNSTAGTITLHTKTPVFRQVGSWHGQLGAGFKSVNNEINTQYSLGYGNKKFAFRTNATFRKANNYKSGGGSTVNFSQYQKNNLAISGSYLMDDNTLLTAEYIFDLAQNVGYPALPMDVSAAKGNIYSLAMVQYYEHSEVEAKLYGSNIFHQMDDSQREVIMHMDMPGWSNTYGAYVNWTRDFSPNVQWNASLDYYLSQSRAEMTMYPNNEIPMYMLTWPDVQKNDVALSIANTLSWGDKWEVSNTARIELGVNQITDPFGIKQLEAIGYVGISGNVLVLPFISSHWNVNVTEKSKINFSIKYSQRQASVTEGFGYYLFNAQDNYDYIGNPYLKPEEALAVETGYGSRLKTIEWHLQVFSYYMPQYILGEYRPEYSPMTIGATGVKFYVNLPWAMLSGFEGNALWQLTPNLALGTRFQYSYGVDNDGVALPLIPPLKNKLTLKYTKKDWGIGVQLQSVTTQNNVRYSFGETKTPGYNLLNAQAHYSISLGKSSLTFNVEAANILDTFYIDHLNFNSIPGPGRSVNFSALFSLN